MTLRQVAESLDRAISKLASLGDEIQIITTTRPVEALKLQEAPGVLRIIVRREAPGECPFIPRDVEACRRFREANQRRQAELTGNTPHDDEGPHEAQEGGARLKTADVASAEARELARKVAATPAKQAQLTRDIIHGIRQVEIPADIVKLANDTGHEVVVSHRGVELHRNGQRVLTVTSPGELWSPLMAISELMIEELLS